MIKKVAIAVALGLTFAASVMGAATAKDVKIGVVVKIGGIPWFNAMEAGIKDAARRWGRRLHGRPDQCRPRTAGSRHRGSDRAGRKVIGVVPNDAEVLEPVLQEGARCRDHRDHP